MNQPTEVLNFSDGNGWGNGGWGGIIPGFIGGLFGGALFGNEAVGYLSGDAAFLLAEDICAMGCPCCCDKKQ